MALTIKNKFVKETIVDENGNKLGELKFNPNDSRIMKKLTEIVNYASLKMKEIDKIGEIKDISKMELKTLEDFENVAKEIEKMDKGFDIEVDVVDKIITELSDIFGKETIELFTQGTKDADCLLPILDFIEPYVKKARENKVNKYLQDKEKTNSDVME